MEILSVIETGINRELKHLEIASQNVANINTPGYQAIQSFDVSVNAQDVTSLQKISNADSAINQTSRALDWAIQGQGYFVIEKSGEFFLTRYGRFHVDENGGLRHISGGNLVGESGPIQVVGPVTISPEGKVSSSGELVDSVKLVDVQNIEPSRFSGLFRANSTVKELREVRVAPFSLNTSNVSSSDEMTRVIEVSRHIQSLQKAALAYDQMLSFGINEIGKK